MQVLTNKGFRIIFFTYCCLTEQRAKVADIKRNLTAAYSAGVHASEQERNVPMNKKPFVTYDKLQEIVKEFPTPFHLYDEKGIRENAKALKEAFAWNKGYKEYFAVKATPNPFLIQILREYGCGCDCSSKTELMLSEAIGAKPEMILCFLPTIHRKRSLHYADKLGGIINLDDITHIESSGEMLLA